MAAPHIDRLLETVLRTGATDLWLTPGVPPVVRVDGALRPLETPKLTAASVRKLISAIAPKTKLTELETTGRTHFAFAFGKKGRFRASACRQAGGWSLSLRFIPPAPFSIEDVGLPLIVKALCRRPRGLFLVAGPAGSGRTTVLAALIHYINTLVGDRRIFTVEDPIEYVHVQHKCLVSQLEIGTHVATYGEGIAELGRQGASVVVIGDLDDAAVLHAAAQLARTDALVFGHLRARGAREVIELVCDAHGDRLRESWRAAAAESLLAALSCELCPRLDGGMVPAFEFLVNTPATATLIREGSLDRVDNAIRTGGKYGMQLLDDHLHELWQAGVIAAEEAIERARDPSAFQGRIEGRLRPGSDDNPLADPRPVRPKRPPPGLSTHAEPPE